MSKAFTRDDDKDPPPLTGPGLPLPPAGLPNYLTDAGLRELRAEAEQLARALAGDSADPGGGGSTAAARQQRLLQLETCVRTGIVVAPGHAPAVCPNFGATVAFVTNAKQHRAYTLVGVAEAAAAAGRISWLSPLGQSLRNVRAGDVVTLEAPGGDYEAEIVSVLPATSEPKS